MMFEEFKVLFSLIFQFKVVVVLVKLKKVIECNKVVFDFKRWTLEYLVFEEQVQSYYRICEFVGLN